MIVIFGAGNNGKRIRDDYFTERDQVVFYDNDRRNWGAK